MATVLVDSTTRRVNGTGSSESSSVDVVNTPVIDYEKKEASTTVTSQDVPPLGLPAAEKRFWFQRGKFYDPNGIATQVNKTPFSRDKSANKKKPSVYDDPETAKDYMPRSDW
jgi:hypothetical protein